MAADCTSGVEAALRALEKILRIDFWRPGSVGEEKSVGCVNRMSARMCTAVSWRVGWPLLKQWMNRVRFSSARVLEKRSMLVAGNALCDQGQERTYFIEETAEA